MTLNLDPRQRAMLLQMGVRVWQPLPVAETPAAIEVIAASACTASANPRSDQDFQEKKAFPAPATPAAPLAPAVRREAAPIALAVPVRAASPAARPPADIPDDGHAPWQLGQAQPLYADTARPGGARWLVLAQSTAAASQAPVFDGDAGRLLDNMLRAARLNQGAGLVLWAPLVRQAVSGPMEALSAVLSALIAHVRPDVVLVMGRLAAQALLPSPEPFGKLRGRVHTLHGAQTIVTCDAAYLLRTPADKARVWDDLCLAMSLAVPKA